MNDDLNNAALDDRDMRIATNVMLERAGLLRFNRFGTHRDPFGAALNGGADVTGIFDFKSQRGATQRVIFVVGDTLYAENAGPDPSTATDVTGTATWVVSGSNPDEDICTGAIFKDQLFIANRANAPVVIGATGNAADVSNWLGASYTPRFVHQQFGYLFFGGYAPGSPTNIWNPMTVHHGPLLTDDDWHADWVVDRVGGLSAYGDEYVTALFRHRDFLMIGTNERIYPVTYTGSPWGRWAIQRPLEVGVAHQRAVVSINGEYTFFMDPRGHIHTIREVAGTFGELHSQALTSKIRNLIANLNRARIPFCQGVYLEQWGLLLWSIPYGTSQDPNNALLVLDINEFPLDEPDHRLAKWFYWPSRASLDFLSLGVVTRDTNGVSNASEPSLTGEPFLYFGGETGWIKRFSDAISYDEDDSGTQYPIAAEAATKYFDFAEPTDEKGIVEMYHDMTPASDNPGPTAVIDYDYGHAQSIAQQIDMSGNIGSPDLLGTTFILGTSLLGGNNAVTQSREYFTGSGTVASVRWNSLLDGTVEQKMQRATVVVELRGQTPEL